MNFIRDSKTQALIGVPPEGTTEIEKLQAALASLHDKQNDMLRLLTETVSVLKSIPRPSQTNIKLGMIEQGIKDLK